MNGEVLLWTRTFDIHGDSHSGEADAIENCDIESIKQYIDEIYPHQTPNIETTDAKIRVWLQALETKLEYFDFDDIKYHYIGKIPQDDGWIEIELEYHIED